MIAYVRQVNGVNSGDNVFIGCVSVCLCAADWPIRLVWALNANSSKAVKATDFKFDVHVARDSPHMTRYNFQFVVN